MTSKFHRAGALASAAMLFAILLSAEVTLANAEDDMDSSLESQQPAIDDTLPRFVANPVVQAIPEIPSEETSVQLADVAELTANSGASSLAELVGTLGVEAEFSGELKCLAQAVYFESRGEPLDGQLAVAKVVINRSHASAFPSSYCSVVTQRAQFSFVRNGRIPAPKTRTKAWKRAKAIAQIADRDLWESKADEALYFHAKTVRPSWARRMSKQATIDSHIFYR